MKFDVVEILLVISWKTAHNAAKNEKEENLCIRVEGHLELIIVELYTLARCIELDLLCSGW